MALQLQTVVPGAPPQRTALGAGRTRVPARPGTRYQLLDDAGQIPAGVTIKRIENGVVIDGLPGDRSVEITDFFTACGPDSATTCEVSTAELGGKAPITPSSDPLGALSDGSFLLYGGGSQSGAQGLAAPIIAATDNSWKAIGAGLGGIAIAGLAVGGGGGKGETPDTVAPAPPTITNKAAQNSATPTFTGNGEPNSTVLLRIDVDGNGKIDGSDPTFQVSVGADGTWTLPLAGNAPVLGSWSGALPDGNYIVVAVARDAAGNISQPSSTTVAIDTKVPATPTIDLIAGDGTVSGAEAAAGVVVTGTGEAGTSIRITWGSVSKTGTVGADGKWDFLFGPTEIPAQQGSSLVQVTLTDAAGNVSAEGLRPAQIATAPAAPTIDIVAGDGVVSGAEAAAGVAVSGSGESGATVSVTWGSTVKTSSVAADGSWSVLFGTAEIPVTQGASLVQTTLSNATGNVSPTLSRVVIIDTQGPAAPVIANGPLTNLALPTFSGSAEANAKVRVSVDLAGNGSVDAIYETTASAAGSWSVNTQAPAAGTTLVSGSMGAGFADKVGVTLVQNTVAAVAIDAAGNTGVVATTSIARDASIPAAPVINTVAGDNTVNFAERGTIIITGTVPVESSGQPVTVTWGGTSKTVTAAGTNWSTSFSIGEIPADGAAPVTAISQSAAGVQGVQGTLSVTVDGTVPAAPSLALTATSDSGTVGDNVTNDTTPTVRVALNGIGATAPVLNDVVRLTVAGTQVGTATLLATDIANDYVDITTSALAAGSRTIAATVTDVAGNPSPAGSLTLTIDTSTPGAPVPTLTAASNSGSTADLVTSDPTPTIRVSFTGATAGDVVGLTVGGSSVGTATLGAPDIGAGFVDITTTTLADGARTVSATVTNGAGTVSTAGTLALTIDTVAPAAPAITLTAASDTGTSGDFITLDTTPTLRVTLNGAGATAPAAGDVVTLTVGGLTVGTATLTGTDITNDFVDITTSALTPAAGVQTVSATVQDIAGNPSTAGTLAVTISNDATPPAAPTLALAPVSDTGTPGDGITNDATPVVRVTFTGAGATAPVAGDFVQLSVGGTAAGTATLTGTNITNGFVDITSTVALANGVATSVGATIRDIPGNTSTAGSATLTADTSPPPALVAGTNFTFSITDSLSVAYTDINTAVTTGTATNPDTSPLVSFNLITAIGAGESIVINRGTLLGGASVDILTVTATGTVTNNATLAGNTGTAEAYVYRADYVDNAGNRTQLDIDAAGADNLYVIRVA